MSACVLDGNGNPPSSLLLHMKTMSRLSALALVMSLTACISNVDETEHCVATRNGKVINEKVSSGFASTTFSDLECFPVTQVTYPQGSGENAPSMAGKLITADSVVMDVELAVDFRITEPFQAFTVKRNFGKVQSELANAIQAGLRNAGSTIRVESIVGSSRAGIDDKLKTEIQSQVGPYLTIERVYLRSITPPAKISSAWGDAALSLAGQQNARNSYITDSLEARRTVLRAEARAREKALEVQAMATSPAVLELEKIRAFSKGISEALKGCTNNCIIGDGVLAKFLNGAPR